MRTRFMTTLMAAAILVVVGAVPLFLVLGECVCADLPASPPDGDVDLHDFISFQRAYSGGSSSTATVTLDLTSLALRAGFFLLPALPLSPSPRLPAFPHTFHNPHSAIHKLPLSASIMPLLVKKIKN